MFQCIQAMGRASRASSGKDEDSRRTAEQMARSGAKVIVLDTHKESAAFDEYLKEAATNLTGGQ